MFSSHASYTSPVQTIFFKARREGNRTVVTEKKGDGQSILSLAYPRRIDYSPTDRFTAIIPPNRGTVPGIIHTVPLYQRIS
jgi:hypothetical protein